MSEDRDRRPEEAREALETAALRAVLAERTEYDSGAVPQDDRWEAGDALAPAARALVQTYNLCGTHLWQMDENEALSVKVQRLTEENGWLRAAVARNDRVIELFVDYHCNVHPLPEDVRKQVVAAMDGTDVSEVRD